MSRAVADISSFLVNLEINEVLLYLLLFTSALILIFIILKIKTDLYQRSRAYHLDASLNQIRGLLEKVSKDNKTLKSTFLSAINILQDILKTQGMTREDLTAVQRSLLDIASVQEGGGKISDAIELAKSGESPEKIVDETGLPLETAKAISIFHNR